MAALSAARITRNKGQVTHIQSYKIKGATTIYAGGIVMLGNDGYARPAAALASNLGCVGIAEKTVVNSGADGAEEVLVDEGVFLLNATSITQAMVGLKVYASDDQTVDETQGTNEPFCGVIKEFVSTTSAWVEISPALTRGVLG